VGNTLNSVNVSVSLLDERLRGSRLSGLGRAAELLRENASRLGEFLTDDARGRQLPEYLEVLFTRLSQERAELQAEVRTLSESVEHIKAVVSMQQEHARSGGVVETLPVAQLIDDALRLHAKPFERLGIQVRREYARMPPVQVDRHKLLQIILNLLSNARHALLDSGREDKQLTIRVAPVAEGRVRIEVADNGVGISQETLPHLFTQGFTTKKDGHGFGLHISALAAAEMQGSLTCASEGPGLGATFTLELSLPPAEARP
jgi:signal transduction histidine kinase